MLVDDSFEIGAKTWKDTKEWADEEDYLEKHQYKMLCARD
jgi:hypothetical protein